MFDYAFLSALWLAQTNLQQIRYHAFPYLSSIFLQSKTDKGKIPSSVFQIIYFADNAAIVI